MGYMGISNSNMSTKRLKKMNWKKIGRNLLLFWSPTFLAVLIALQGVATQGLESGSFIPSKGQLIFILGSGYSAFLGTAIDVIKKFQEVKEV